MKDDWELSIIFIGEQSMLNLLANYQGRGVVGGMMIGKSSGRTEKERFSIKRTS